MRIKHLCLFLLMGIFSVQIVCARELTGQEKLSLATLQRTLNIKEYMRMNISEDDLSWRQWGEYQLLLKSCAPVISRREKILAASDDLPDQSQKLHVLYNACQEGVLSLTRLYTEVYP